MSFFWNPLAASLALAVLFSWPAILVLNMHLLFLLVLPSGSSVYAHVFLFQYLSFLFYGFLPLSYIQPLHYCFTCWLIFQCKLIDALIKFMSFICTIHCIFPFLFISIGNPVNICLLSFSSYPILAFINHKNLNETIEVKTDVMFIRYALFNVNFTFIWEIYSVPIHIFSISTFFFALGFRPLFFPLKSLLSHTCYVVLPHLLIVCIAIFIASAHNSLLGTCALIMVLLASSRVLISISTLSFCKEVYMTAF